METIHDTPIDLIKVQRTRRIIEVARKQKREITEEKSKDILEDTIVYLEGKLDKLERAEKVRRKRSSDYSSENVAIDLAKDYWQLKDNLEKHSIYLRKLKELVAVLETLKERELPSFSVLGRSKGVLNKLEDYILSQE